MSFNWENFTYNTAWLQEAVQIEVQADCDIQISGKASGSTLSSEGSKTIAPAQLQAQLQQVRVQSLLFSELRIILEKADLGSGIETALTKGRQLIRARLKQLTSEQHEYFVALIAEDEGASEDKPLRMQLRQVLCSFLSQTDWQQIAQVAMGTIQTHLLQQVAVR